MYKKKFKIEGKYYTISDLKSKKKSNYTGVLDFLEQYFSDDHSFLVETSGSTGKPKTIAIQKKYMRASAQKTLTFLNIKPHQSILLCISPKHIGGIMVLVRWIEGDLDLYPQLPSSKPLQQFHKTIDFASMVPLQLAHSLDDLHKVKTIIVGGGAIVPQLWDKLSGAKTSLWQSYGMTETISHIALRKITKSAQAYKVLDGVYLEVNKNSCLRITAPDIGVVDLQTNDVVEKLDEQHFYWKGRIDNVVNSGGVKLFPEDIEHKIGDIGNPYFLAGIPDDILGEKLVMFVETEEAISLNLYQEQLGMLTPYEKPKAVFAIKHFERTATEKIRRAATILKKL